MLFTRPAAGFSHVASNILVAGAGGTPLAERSLSGMPLDASIDSASKETLGVPRFRVRRGWIGRRSYRCGDFGNASLSGLESSRKSSVCDVKKRQREICRACVREATNQATSRSSALAGYVYRRKHGASSPNSATACSRCGGASESGVS